MENYSFLKTNDPYVLTPKKLVRYKLELLELQDGDILIDMGVGDARSLIMACEMADVKGIGYEISSEITEIARKNVADAELSNRIEIINKSMYDADLSKANTVIIYLTRTMLGAISEKLENELPHGARIVTHQFDLPGWTAEKELEVTYEGCQAEMVYLYRKS